MRARLYEKSIALGMVQMFSLKLQSVRLAKRAVIANWRNFNESHSALSLQEFRCKRVDNRYPGSWNSDQLWNSQRVFGVYT